jgi:hypothetical protein
MQAKRLVAAFPPEALPMDVAKALARGRHVPTRPEQPKQLRCRGHGTEVRIRLFGRIPQTFLVPGPAQYEGQAERKHDLSAKKNPSRLILSWRATTDRPLMSGVPHRLNAAEQGNQNAALNTNEVKAKACAHATHTWTACRAAMVSQQLD